MKRNFWRLIVLTVLTMLICGCFSEEKIETADMRGGKIKESSVAKPERRDERKENRVAVSEPPADSLEEQLKSMSLEEKVGQMMIVGFNGTELNDDIIYSLNQFHFGGIILYDRNLESVAQAKALTEALQTKQKIPLFIAIDEEGGQVVRGQNFLPPAPSQEEIGRGGDVSAATYWAEYNVDLLRSIGVNLNFAPVADVGSKDTRSFASDAQTVAEFVEASAQGYERQNFFYTLKHFPGIGKGKTDTHKEVSHVEDSRDVLDAEDLPPFARIIQDHDNSRFMVMVGHLIYDAIDPNNSASLSRAVITDLLRDELGFDGVVVTDDLEMGAIKNNVDLSTIGVRTILAGNDIALVCHNPESQRAVYYGIINAVRRGEISEERINESVRRILKMKAHLNRQ